ncbi:O-methyltransferase [Streptomyces sp. NRRL S-1824]|uniref:O-methyltransferase n=1 Tax=Streptomyces sp. NRRL S-1824 TaxID=1463889 RepID=UPI00099BBA39|nr:class I SAM-dependent methyltransferase [Streptomyces sp. NRRL S-1824]
MIDRPKHIPGRVQAAHEISKQFSFEMACKDRTGALLRTLAATKPGGQILELGTGTGVGTAWILDGMDSSAHLITVDRDKDTSDLARQVVGEDARVDLIVADVASWLKEYDGAPFDMVFVDTWRGKFIDRAELLRRLAPGGIYFGDDLLPQPTWDPEQPALVDSFLREIVEDSDLAVTMMNWSSGLVLAAKQK